MRAATLALSLFTALGATENDRPLAIAAAADQHLAAIPTRPFVEEFEVLQREAQQLLEAMRGVRAGFSPDADFTEAKTRFDETFRRLMNLFDRAKELEDRFTSHVKQKMSLLIVAGIGAYTNPTRHKPTEQALQNAGGALLDEDLKDQIRTFRRNLDGELLSAQAHFTDFERTWHQRRNARLVYAAVGGLAAALVVVATWLYRRKPEVVTIPAYPTGAQGLPTTPPSGRFLSGPAQGALLSGPVGAPQAAPPDTIGGNFRVDRELGRGGMGVVYEATDLALGRKVAIKRMREEVSANRRELDMFLAEARLVAQLKHPNLVAIHHIFREAEVVYLVFEYVAGRALSAVLEEQEILPLDEARRILRGVGAGLDHAHANKVIHRDLKPSNVMLSDDGIVKVMDFGIAHQAKKTVARVTKADAWGTPPYMSPEQELGTVSRESDIYSLSVLLYEMVTGRLPFEGPNFLAQKREMTFAPPSQAGLPAGLDAVVRKGLEAEAPRRFHSAAELLAALDGV